MTVKLLNKQFHIIIILILFLIGAVQLSGQNSSVDSTSQAPGVLTDSSSVIADSSAMQNLVPPDSTALASSDSSAAVKTQQSDIDTTLFYDAKDIYMDVANKSTLLVGKAIIKYKNITLQAGKITLDTENTMMIAESISDSVWVISDSASGDSVLQVTEKELPILIEGSSKLSGYKMYYNYKTEKGRIVKGRTELEGGVYQGEQIKRINDNTFLIKNSTFTTCDLDSNPHFHIEATRMKMMTNDKVIAKPIVMYLGHIPLMALPFAVFPNKSGRQSGIIVPTYGESTQEGRALRGMGYYWAPSDYYDTRLQADFFEKSGWFFRGGLKYNARYKLNGSLDGSYTRKEDSNGNKIRRWDMTVNHRQTIDQTSQLSVSGRFISDKDYLKNYSTNISTRLTQELRSNATYSKNWTKQKFSMSVNVSQVHNLQTDLVSQTFPQISFRRGQTQLFKRSKSKPGEKRKSSQPAWYESLYFNYSSNLENRSQQRLVTTTLDSVENTSKVTDRYRKFSHTYSLSLQSPKKFFGWLSLNQSLNGNEDWFAETFRYKYNEETKTVEQDTVSGFAARHTFNYSASANTKFYGMISPGIANIQAIRHVVTPSLSFNYQPDFSEASWGYFTKVQTPDGALVKKDKFGGTSSGGRKNISLNVNNLFQMKKGYGEEEKKIDLFSMNFGTGFNFEAEKNKLSNLNTNWQASPAKNFSLNASTSSSFYQWQETGSNYGGTRSNTYLFENGGWKKGNFVQLTSLNLGFSLRLQGKEDKKNDENRMKSDSNLITDEEPDPLAEEENLSVLEEDLIKKGSRFENNKSLDNFSLPWKTSLTFGFAINKTDPSKPTKNYYMNVGSMEMNLTRNWRLGYTARFDIVKKQIAYHSFTFFRDLHCWEANINWVPSGNNKSLYVKINIKASVLQDIKLEKRGGRQSMVY